MRSKSQPKSSEKVKFRDMYSIVSEVLIAMPAPGPTTSFKFDETEVFENLVQQIKRDCPTMAAKLMQCCESD
jgi:hypothetical protein